MASKRYEDVKRWYLNHLWPIEWCRNAVIKNWITAEEFKSITGEDY